MHSLFFAFLRRLACPGLFALVLPACSTNPPQPGDAAVRLSGTPPQYTDISGAWTLDAGKSDQQLSLPASPASQGSMRAGRAVGLPLYRRVDREAVAALVNDALLGPRLVIEQGSSALQLAAEQQRWTLPYGGQTTWRLGDRPLAAASGWSGNEFVVDSALNQSSGRLRHRFIPSPDGESLVMTLTLWLPDLQGASIQRWYERTGR